MTLTDLLAVVLDPKQSVESKTLAVSVAYHKGMNEGLSLAKESADRIRPKVIDFRARP